MPRIRSTGFSICPHQLMDQIGDPGGKQRVCVYLVLHRYGNGSEQGCYASVTTLSGQLGMTRRDVMTAIHWLIDNGWASYTNGDGRKRHIYLNVDRRKQRSSGAQKGTASQTESALKGTIAESAQKGTVLGDQKGTLSISHELDPSISSLLSKDNKQAIDTDIGEKKVNAKGKQLPQELDPHRDLIHAFWKIKKGSKGDIAWKLLCTELLKFHNQLGPLVVEEQLTHAINGKWAGVSFTRHLQFNPHLVTISHSSSPEYSIR